MGEEIETPLDLSLEEVRFEAEERQEGNAANIDGAGPVVRGEVEGAAASVPLVKSKVSIEVIGLKSKNVESSGRPIFENLVPVGVTATHGNPLSVPPVKSVGLQLPSESVSLPVSRRENVDEILDDIVRGNLQPGRARFLPPNVHPGSSEMLLRQNNSYLPLVTTMTHVTYTTTTTTQSSGTVPSLRNSLSSVMTTSYHVVLPGDHPPRPSFSVPLVVSPSPMVTTCSVTSHSSTPIYVSSPSVSQNPLPAAADDGGSVPFFQIPPTVVIAQEDVVAAFTSGIRELVLEMKSSPAHDLSHYSEASDNNLAANKQLALAQIKADNRAERFSGKDASSYLRWKKALKRELHNINPGPEEWLQMLKLRTIDVAAGVVGSVEETSIENPQEALQTIWNHFDRRYKSTPKAASKLLNKIQTFPTVSVNNVDKLWDFALACFQAATLMYTEQSRQLCALDFPAAPGGGMS